MINLSDKGNPEEFLNDLKKTITDLVSSYFEGNWHIIMDYLSPIASGDTNYRDLLDLYKMYELSHPDMCGIIAYL